ncbi:hypothetical protein AHAS_Ahas01G0081600 [Arachis hypogaea]
MEKPKENFTKKSTIPIGESKRVIDIIDLTEDNDDDDDDIFETNGRKLNGGMEIRKGKQSSKHKRKISEGI